MWSLDLSSVVFETTSHCHQDCLFCYNIWKAGHPAFPLDFAQAHRSLRRLFDIADVRHITFSGGEPLLLERLPELVLFARRKGASVNVITAGYRKNAFASELLDLGVSLFQLPYHSHLPDVHDRLTGLRGSHAQTEAAFEFYRRSGAHVAAVLVLTSLNAPQLTRTLLTLRDRGIRHLLVNRFNPGGRGLDHRDELEMPPDALNACFNVLNDAASEDFTISSGVNTPFCLLDPRRYPRLAFGGCRVKHGQGPITLVPSGDIRLCNHSPHSLGNILVHTLDQLCRAPIIVDWQCIPPDCDGCPWFDLCSGGCRAASEQVGASARHADPYFARFRTLAQRREP